MTHAPPTNQSELGPALPHIATVPSSPAGPGPGATVQLKNGWMSRATFGWRINSIGHVSGRGRNYAIAILSQNNPSMPYGITTAESISRVIWRDLAP